MQSHDEKLNAIFNLNDALVREKAVSRKLADALRAASKALHNHFNDTCDGTEVRAALNADKALAAYDKEQQ